MDRSNPFPGMNPYLETKWGDVHVKLIALIAMELGTDLPDGLLARGESHVSVSREEGETSNYWPDIKINEESGFQSGLPPLWNPNNDEAAVAVAEPKIVILNKPVERWIEITDVDGKLITVIEVLSPTNKSRGRREYLAKRDDYVAAGINIVEIDLLRKGRFTVNLPVEIEEQEPRMHTVICVTRGWTHQRCEYYACDLHDPDR